MSKKIIVLVIFGIFGTSLNLLADTAYIKENTKIFKNNSEVGVIRVLTPVEIVSKKADKTKIKVSGYLLENYPISVVKGIKKAEEYVKLNQENESLFKKIKKEEDAYGEIWYKVEGTFTILSKSITLGNKALYDQAQKAYETSCALCHGLPEAKSHTVSQWPGQIKAMASKIALDSNTIWLISKYLQQNAKDAN